MMSGAIIFTPSWKIEFRALQRSRNCPTWPELGASQTFQTCIRSHPTGLWDIQGVQVKESSWLEVE